MAYTPTLTWCSSLFSSCSLSGCFSSSYCSSPVVSHPISPISCMPSLASWLSVKTDNSQFTPPAYTSPPSFRRVYPTSYLICALGFQMNLSKLEKTEVIIVSPIYILPKSSPPNGWHPYFLSCLSQVTWSSLTSFSQMLLAHVYSLNPSLKILPLIHPILGTLVFFYYSGNTPSCLYLRTFAHISPLCLEWYSALSSTAPCSSLKRPLPHFIGFLLNASFSGSACMAS